MNLKQVSQVLLVTALAGLGLSAQAAESWTYTGTSGGNGVDSTSSSNALTTTGVYASNTSTTTCTAYSAGSGCYANRYSSSGGANSGRVKVGNYWYSGTGSTNTTYGNGLNAGNWSAGPLTNYSGGLGMITNETNGGTDPNHAVDNAGQYTEGVLLSFSASTMLTGIDIGYKGADADISVWAYLGSGIPGLTTTGAGKDEMLAAGWSLVGNYGDLATDSASPYKFNLVNGATDTKETPKDDVNTVNPTASNGSIASSWWLITAYNSSYGPATSGSVNQGNDYFKLLSVAGTTCTKTSTQTGCGNTPNNEVPEPASLALVCVGLLGVVGLRRQRKQAA